MLIIDLREQLDHYHQLNPWIKDQENKLDNLFKENELCLYYKAFQALVQ
ncbi:hypothetical protein PE36_11867 [Moritella sp. PE36]|nr:hypothetical protein PE36_11867 [Moritella sp. PE36]